LIFYLFRVVKFYFFPNRGSIDTNQSKTGYSIACCSNVDTAIGLNVDRRAGWELTEHGLLSHLMWFGGHAWHSNARFCASLVWQSQLLGGAICPVIKAITRN